MSLAHRIIPCLDTDGARVVKGVNFVGLRDAGDPAALAARYNAEGADELVVLDIAASRDRRPTFLETIRRVADAAFVPSTMRAPLSSPAPTKSPSTLPPSNASTSFLNSPVNLAGKPWFSPSMPNALMITGT
jgi:hypothetical protein